MSRFSYSYQTVVRYNGLIGRHNFLLRCQPREDCGVRIVEQNIELLSSVQSSSGVDVFGNKIIYGSMATPHDIFVVSVNGVVECGEYRVVESELAPFYRAFTHKTEASREIVEFGFITPPQGSSLDEAIELSQRLHSKMSYTPGVTTSETTASDSFAMSAGVCQDFSHLLISLCRVRGIPARYVAGLVIGTGQTHAWVEVFSRGVWHGVDPTHNRVVERGYIKLAHGRDAADCSVARGVHRGASVFHTTDVRVVVNEI